MTETAGDGEAASGRHRKKGQRSFLAELPILIIVALAVAIFIKTFFVQAFWIPSGSMIPELQVNDRVMVNKLSYRLSEPDRGDIIVFLSPFATDHSEESVFALIGRTIGESLGVTAAAIPDDLIKRIVGLPGETIEIRNNTLYIDGSALEEPYLPVGVSMDDMPPRTLRSDELFVMGDNRNASSDSRRFGPITTDDVVGRAFIRIWPSDRWGRL
ncbi:MAG: signal peptidase I [Acidimicrobiia bacterium]|nr:signal peptidase I [Acidimicrobiia bacterium]